MELENRLNEFCVKVKEQSLSSSFKKHRWGEDIKDEAIYLIKNGISRSRLSSLSSLSYDSINKWYYKNKKSDFKEISVVKNKIENLGYKNSFKLIIKKSDLEFEIMELNFEQLKEILGMRK